MHDDVIARAKQTTCAQYAGAVPGWRGRRQGYYIVGPCPVCLQGDDRFYINTQTERWGLRKCVHGRRPAAPGGDIGGDVIDLVEMVEGVNKADAIARLTGRAQRAVELGTHKTEKPASGRLAGAGSLGGTPMPTHGSSGNLPATRHKFKIDWKHPQAVFDYYSADGRFAFRRTRYGVLNSDGTQSIGDKGKQKKQFFYSHKEGGDNGHGPARWVKGQGLAPHVPYRLPELIAARAEMPVADVYITEGEAKADLLRSWGLIATSFLKDTRDYGQWFEGAHVVFVPDNDKPGHDYMRAVARGLGGAASIRVREIPDLGPAEDVLDAAGRGLTAQAFMELRDRGFESEEEEEEDTSDSGSATGDEGRDGFSDDALALRLLDEQCADLRYVEMWKRWLQWDGARWRKEETLAIFDISRELVRRISQETSDWRVQKALRGQKTVAAIENLSRSDRRVALRTADLDQHPWLFNATNGTVDLRTGELRPHDKDDHLTKVAGSRISDGHDCPQWAAFIDRITDGDIELAGFLQRMVGYAMTGSTREQCLFFLFGHGANGKSVFLSVISHVLGDYHITAPIETFTEVEGNRHPTELASLFGARLVTSIETEEGRRWSESKIKSLTGGDRISARFMRQDFFEFTPQFKLIIAGNHKPTLRTIDEAIRRRFRLVPFAVTIPEHERDHELPAKLMAEAPGILRWAIAGCLEWQETGLAPPEAVLEATAEYLQAEDVISAWIDECCMPDITAWKSSTDLFNSWSQWCQRSGEYVGSHRKFSQKLINRPGITKDDHDNGRGYRGLRFKDQFE